MDEGREESSSGETGITDEYLVDWIDRNQSTRRPERPMMPRWFYPKVARVIAPTVRVVVDRRRRKGDGGPVPVEEGRDAVAREVMLRIARIWGRVRAGTLVCRRCGGEILGEDFVFDWKGVGPYNIWHTACYARHQVDPQPFYTPPRRGISEADQYRMDLEERRDMVRAERRRRDMAAGTVRAGTAGRVSGPQDEP